MLENVLDNIQFGINHVLDINGYDHVLFLIVLTIPYVFKDFKRLFLLVSLFTLGHSLSLVLATYGVVKVNSNIIEFLIPVTILIMAVHNVFVAGKKAQNKKVGLLFFSTLFFGLVHGFGFSRALNMLVQKGESKLLVLLEFALGIEIAQIIIVFIVLFLGYLMQTIFRFSKRDWVIVISSVVIGLIIPMLINRNIF